MVQIQQSDTKQEMEVTTGTQNVLFGDYCADTTALGSQSYGVAVGYSMQVIQILIHQPLTLV